MNYDLAKKLKDAGFPQTFVEGRKAIVNENNSDYAFEPTLSELIEACGDDFCGLYQQDKRDWMAIGFVGGIQIKMMDKGISGKTPEESVANLWLKLHEHK